jgi:hypothetical protein
MFRRPLGTSDMDLQSRKCAHSATFSFNSSEKRMTCLKSVSSYQTNITFFYGSCSKHFSFYSIHRIFLDFSIVLYLKNTTLRKLDLFPSSDEGGEKTPTQLGPLERANLNHDFSFYEHLARYSRDTHRNAI